MMRLLTSALLVVGLSASAHAGSYRPAPPTAVPPGAGVLTPEQIEQLNQIGRQVLPPLPEGATWHGTSISPKLGTQPNGRTDCILVASAGGFQDWKCPKRH